MGDNSWLAVVLGISGAVAIVALALVARSARPARSRVSASTDASSAVRSSASDPDRRRRSPLSFRPWSRSRSVGANFERAVARIDSVDPYEMPRRIGAALAQVGLLAPVPGEQDDEPTGHTWPFGPVSGRRRNEDT